MIIKVTQQWLPCTYFDLFITVCIHTHEWHTYTHTHTHTHTIFKSICLFSFVWIQKHFPSSWDRQLEHLCDNLEERQIPMKCFLRRQPPGVDWSRLSNIICQNWRKIYVLTALCVNLSLKLWRTSSGTVTPPPPSGKKLYVLSSWGLILTFLWIGAMCFLMFTMLGAWNRKNCILQI